jgi:hypothetical protein
MLYRDALILFLDCNYKVMFPFPEKRNEMSAGYFVIRSLLVAERE